MQPRYSETNSLIWAIFFEAVKDSCVECYNFDHGGETPSLLIFQIKIEQSSCHKNPAPTFIIMTTTNFCFSKLFFPTKDESEAETKMEVKELRRSLLFSLIQKRKESLKHYSEEELNFQSIISA